MSYLYTFEATTFEKNKARINKLTTITQPLWGKMDVAQMLAHLNVTYLLAQGTLQPRINPLMRFILKAFVKKTVVGNKPYTKNGQTAPYFLIADKRDFEKEKKVLLEGMKWVDDKGEDFFNNKPTASFGKLSTQEWSNMFQKHLDHHLKQFGV